MADVAPDRDQREIAFAQHRSANRFLLIILFVTVGLLAVAAFLTSNRDSKSYSANSPEGVIQLYLNAVIDGKLDKAATYFSKDSTCSATDIDRAYVSDNFRVNLSGTEVTANRAYVKIEVEFTNGGPFENGYSEKQTYRLAQEAGVWKILGIPWPLYDCGVKQ